MLQKGADMNKSIEKPHWIDEIIHALLYKKSITRKQAEQMGIPAKEFAGIIIRLFNVLPIRCNLQSDGTLLVTNMGGR